MYLTKFSKYFIGLVFVMLSFSSTGYALELQCGHLSPIQMRFLARHVNFSEPSKNLESRTIDQFVKHLDGSKTYFLESDVENIKKTMNGVFTQVQKGNCRPIFDVYTILKNRVKEASAFVETTVSHKDFKFDKTTKLLLDNDKRQYPKTKKDAEEFWKKYVHLQLANYLALDKPIEEAKEKVIKNYKRLVKRIDEEEEWDILATYLDSFASALDPHSNFWGKAAFEDFETTIRLSLEGIGATLSSRDGMTTVEELVPGGAAARSGKLKPKDIILAVGQGEKGDLEDVVDQELRDVVRKIRGKKGTTVRLLLLRKTDETSQKFEITLVRDKVKLEDEAAFVEFVDREMDGKKLKVALLNLPQFYADNVTNERSSAGDIKKLLKQIRDAKADAVVFDLSNNGGGSLQDAVEIAGQFFRVGNVVKQNSRDVMAGEITLADKDATVDWSGPLVVLTSRVTASASEIVAGTLQDYKRAVIVGADHTFGKGTVQTVEDLPQKLGALKTTIGLYFIPSGRSTQHGGIVSEIEFPSIFSQDETTGEKNLDYSLPPKKIKPFLSAESFVPPGQPGAWKLIDAKTVAKLKEKSMKRIAKDPEFQKIRDDIAKAKAKKKGEIVVSDFLKDKVEADKEEKKDEGKNYEETRASRRARYMKRADVQEAINIASDLAVMQGGGIPVTISSKQADDNSASNQVNRQKETN